MIEYKGLGIKQMPKTMKLDEWLNLSPEQRDIFRQKWKEGQCDWYNIVCEAIESFKKKYEGIHEISSIDPASGYGRIPEVVLEPCIQVTTSLKGNQFIKELPSEYAYFKVVQEPFGDTAEAYLREWILILGNLLRWPEEKVVSWAEKYHSDDLKGKNGWFDHDFASHYVAHLLVPEEKLNRLIEVERSKFLGKIERAIRNFGQNLLDPSYDWAEARKRVNAILKEIGETLP